MTADPALLEIVEADLYEAAGLAQAVYAKGAGGARFFEAASVSRLGPV